MINNKSPYWKPVEGASIVLKEPKELFSISLQIGYNPFSKQLNLLVFYFELFDL